MESTKESGGISVTPKMKYAKTLGERIHACRLRDSLTQKELGEKLGIKSSTIISRWESGKSIPAIKKQERLAELFRVYPKWLISGTGPINKKDEESKAAEAIKAREVKPAEESREDRIEAELKLVNSLIVGLSKSRAKANARPMHQMLSELRSDLEEKLFFGDTSKPRVEKAWSETDAIKLRSINDLIFILKDEAAGIDPRAIDDLYFMLNEKRFDLEVRMLHS